jgi:acylphosphatase
VTARRRVVVRGRVQGVFFRDSCRQRAEEAGVAGSVRNLDDGGLEAVFEGDEAAVGRLVEWCSKGPRGARVDSVDVAEEDPRGVSGFMVA